MINNLYDIIKLDEMNDECFSSVQAHDMSSIISYVIIESIPKCLEQIYFLFACYLLVFYNYRIPDHYRNTIGPLPT